MRTLSLIHRSTTSSLETGLGEAGSLDFRARNREGGSVYEFPSHSAFGRGEGESALTLSKDGFFRNLSDKAKIDFLSDADRLLFPHAATLIKEGERPARILLLIEGKAKLSMNSADGRRLTVGIASPGDVLGLASAVSGRPYGITAEAQFPCIVSSFPRQSFLDFLGCNPVARENVAHQLSLEHTRAMEQLRTVGLMSTSKAKLARLFLDWCGDDSRIQCPFTHGEIGEFIGASRETTTRCLNDFKRQGLIAQRGTALTLPDRNALAAYAGISSTLDPCDSAA